MNTEVILFGLVFAGVGIFLLVSGGKTLRQWRQISTNDPVDIRDATTESDLVEIEGRVRPHDSTLESPHFGKECVVYEYKTEERRRRRPKNSKSRKRWKTIDSGQSSRPFVVEDESGTAYVDPNSASLSLASERRRHKNTQRNSSPVGSTLGMAVSAVVPALGGLGSRKRRYTEKRLDLNGQCYVAGAAERPPAGVDADVSIAGTDVSTFLVSDTTEAKTRLRILSRGLLYAVGRLMFVVVGLAVSAGLL